ncbi:MAG: glycosyltransferase family 2 protein [Pseudomonadota bacterium]
MLDPLAELAEHPLSRPFALRLQRRRQARNLAKLDAAGRPLVSVVMAARNAEATVTCALESLLAQSYGNLEIIVVNDASEDGTAALVTQLMARDPRISLISLPTQQGAALARNRGFERVTGNYICSHDADDRSRPDRIERQLVFLMRDPRRMAAVCAYRRIDRAGRPLRVNGALHHRSNPSLLFRRDPVLEELGGLAPMKRGEDSEYVARITARYGRQARALLYAPLLEAYFSPNSLLWSDSQVRQVGDNVVYDRSETAPTEAAKYEAWHQSITLGTSSPFQPFRPDETASDGR